MKRVPPPEVDMVKNWCFTTKRFAEANFLSDVKRCIENEQKLNRVQANKLTDILMSYKLDQKFDTLRRGARW